VGRSTTADVLRRSSLLALFAVVGPGLLAGLSDDDPAGITTYSLLGADYGYELLWVLVLSTAALVLFHEFGARMGIATGQGLAGLIRERYGLRLATLAVGFLLVANIGTTCAEFAGVAAGLELAGISRYASVPVAAAAVSLLVLRGSFHRIEHVLLLLGSIFAAYFVSGVLAHPNWGAAARGLVVPTLPMSRHAVLLATATVGTTLAPWGLAFIQSYAVDKRLTLADLRFERIDVVVGALMTGVIGFFIVIACAATLHASGHSIVDARDAAVALRPLAGSFASALFGAGLVGAALLAASILPLSTAYSVSEALGYEASLDDSFQEAPVFYSTFGVVVVSSVAFVLIPGAPLVPILFLSQALNAVLLLPLLIFVYGIVRDRETMGDYASGRLGSAAALIVIALLALCVTALGALSLTH
jgi:NRAMP (natural resistance-associated macrophage protein)-like metal ion transporter